MTTQNICFFSEKIDNPLNQKQQEKVKTWLKKVIDQEKKKLEHLNIIFCNDDYLYELNLTHLNHSTLTDIITFNHSELQNSSLYIEGDLYMSIDRIQENANIFNKTFLQELTRVIVHGVLHLLKYDDKTSSEKLKMREKEDFYLNQLVM